MPTAFGAIDHKLNYQPNTTVNFNALHFGVVKTKQNPISSIFCTHFSKNFIWP